MPDGQTVSNSSCLIVLEAAGLLHILEQLYTIISLPEAVAREWGPPPYSWIQVKPVQNLALVQSLRLELGPGEAEAIALCQELSASRIILDDKKARRIAKQLQLPVTGTLAILLRAKERGLISSVRDAMNSLRKCNFRISAALEQEVLRMAGE